MRSTLAERTPPEHVFGHDGLRGLDGLVGTEPEESSHLRLLPFWGASKLHASALPTTVTMPSRMYRSGYATATKTSPLIALRPIAVQKLEGHLDDGVPCGHAFCR